MGKKGKNAVSVPKKESSAEVEDEELLLPFDRGTLARCLNATSQIAAECNSILRDLLRGRCDYFTNERINGCLRLLSRGTDCLSKCWSIGLLSKCCLRGGKCWNRYSSMSFPSF